MLYQLFTTLAIMTLGIAPTIAQTLLFEDDFNDGVLDPTLWETWLPTSSSSVTEGNGLLRFQDRGWLLSAPGIAGLSGDLMMEGEFSPDLQTGTDADTFRMWVYASDAPADGPFFENTDGLTAAWDGIGQTEVAAVSGGGHVSVTGCESPATGPEAKGFRLATLGGVATFEVWNLSTPASVAACQTQFTVAPGAGNRIIFYNREATVVNHVAFLGNLRVYSISDCNSNSVADHLDILSGSSLDCDLNAIPDECDIAINQGLDCDLNGLIDTCEIAANPDLDGNGNGILDVCDNPGTPYCFGDGTGIICPCLNSGNLGDGCMNSTGLEGARLRGTGHASIANDTLRLLVDGVPGTKPGLLFRGAQQLNGGLGLLVGDGLLCTGGQTARSQIQITSGGSTTFTDFQGAPFGASSYGAGVPTNYQFWYRDPTNTCSGLKFNFSNAWTVTWLP